MSSWNMCMIVFTRAANINYRMLLCQLKEVFNIYSFDQEPGLNDYWGLGGKLGNLKIKKELPFR